MTPAHHFTADEFARYRLRTLAPAEFLRLDDHLAVCESCRWRLIVETGARAGVSDLQAEFSEHLDYADLESWVDGTADQDAAAHLHECARCREEAEDLRRFRTQLKVVAMRRPPLWRGIAAAAAAMVLAGGLGYWGLRPPLLHVSPVVNAPQPAEPEIVLRARAERQLQRSSVLDQLVTHNGVLLGPGAESQGFEVSAPVATAVVSARPVFRWQPLKGAAAYSVSIYDEQFRLIAKSGPVKNLEWQPGQPLPRGKILNWQVTAQTGVNTVHAPAPPSPEARFQVVDEAASAEIETALREHPDDALLLAALYARAGVLDDAAKALDRLPAKDAGLAEALRASLQAMRR